MVRKIRTVLGYVGISLILIVSTFSANMPVVNAEEAVQESTDIQEESRQTDSPETEKSEVESREPDQEDAADTESKQTDDRTPDSTRVGTVNEENEETEEGSSKVEDLIPDVQTDEESIADTVINDDDEVDHVEPVKEDGGRIVFEQKAVSYDAEILYEHDRQVTLYLNNDEGILSVESSDEKVAEIDDWSWEYVSVDLKAPGTAQIHVTGMEGSTDSCTVTVEDPGLVLDDRKISASISEGTVWLSVSQGYGLTYTSSDPSVVQAYVEKKEDPSGRNCRLKLQKPGKAEITVKDFAGRTGTVPVTITEAAWSIEQNRISALLSEKRETIHISTDDEALTFSAKSSDNKVVSIENSNNGTVRYLIKKPGTAEITIADQYGKQETCTITVKPDPISFGDHKAVLYDAYERDKTFQYDLETEGNSIIKAVTSSNTKVVTVQRKKYFWNNKYYLQVRPVGTGTAVITATDQYNQKATIHVTVTQKFTDEKRLTNDL